ncbi:hypothetical protein Salat_2632500 [Sesamum alatum]|uniref:Uncharacterized protein n=1 Tax=Sesamum alatum TaxID=300844 RepID=A0AAE1XNP9_9LAMI|nr:hypothetical protein Salat_2632500 [Sesamum alatum]
MIVIPFHYFLLGTSTICCALHPRRPVPLLPRALDVVKHNGIVIKADSWKGAVVVAGEAAQHSYASHCLSAHETVEARGAGDPGGLDMAPASPRRIRCGKPLELLPTDWNSLKMVGPSITLGGGGA